MDIKNFSDVKTLFLDNKTTKQTLFKNTFWLGVGTGVSKLLKMALIIYVARALGATEYGKFTFALAFVSLFVVFSDLGLSNIIVREFSRGERKAKEFHSILSLKILSGFGMLTLVLIGSFFITLDPAIRKLIWILGAFSAIEGFSIIIYAFFQALQRMEYQAWLTIFESLAVTALGFFVILNYPSVENLSYVYLFSGLIALVSILIFFHFKIFPLRISWQKSVWQKFLLMSWPLALSGAFATLYNYANSVMMGHWNLITETGWYNAAYKIIAVCYIPLGLVFGSFYPVVSSFFKESKEKLQKAWDYQITIVILFTFPLVLGGLVLAPRIISFVYGPDFTPAILVFQILIVMAGINFFCTPLECLLIAANREKIFFWLTSSAALLNIILNFILIPKFSLYGAAVATVITYLLIFFLFLRFTMKFAILQPFTARLIPIFIGAFLSSILMYFVISQPKIYYLNVFLSILIGAISYMVALFILRKFLSYF